MYRSSDSREFYCGARHIESTVNALCCCVPTVRRLAVPFVGSIGIHVVCLPTVRQVLTVRRLGGPVRRTVRRKKAIHDLKCTQSGATGGGRWVQAT